MYGRPEGFTSSCLRAFDDSIIPIPVPIDRSPVSKSFSGRCRFFSLRFIEARKFEGLEDYRIAAIPFSRGKKSMAHVRRILAWPPRIHFHLGPSILRTVTESGTLGWEWRRPLFNRHIPRAVGPILQAWETRFGIKFAAGRRHGVIPLDTENRDRNLPRINLRRPF